MNPPQPSTNFDGYVAEQLQRQEMKAFVDLWSPRVEKESVSEVEIEKKTIVPGYQQVNPEGWKIGDCQFYPIAEQYFERLSDDGKLSKQFTADEIRAIAVREIRKGRVLDGLLSNVRVIVASGQEIAVNGKEEYLSKMEKPGTWGDFNTLIALATPSGLNAPIVVFYEDSDWSLTWKPEELTWRYPKETLKPEVLGDGLPGEPILISYNRKTNHFRMMKPDEGCEMNRGQVLAAVKKHEADSKCLMLMNEAFIMRLCQNLQIEEPDSSKIDEPMIRDLFLYYLSLTQDSVLPEHNQGSLSLKELFGLLSLGWKEEVHGGDIPSIDPKHVILKKIELITNEAVKKDYISSDLKSWLLEALDLKSDSEIPNNVIRKRILAFVKGKEEGEEAWTKREEAFITRESPLGKAELCRMLNLPVVNIGELDNAVKKAIEERKLSYSQLKVEAVEEKEGVRDSSGSSSGKQQESVETFSDRGSTGTGMELPANPFAGGSDKSSKKPSDVDQKLVQERNAAMVIAARTSARLRKLEELLLKKGIQLEESDSEDESSVAQSVQQGSSGGSQAALVSAARSRDPYVLLFRALDTILKSDFPNRFKSIAEAREAIKKDIRKEETQSKITQWLEGYIEGKKIVQYLASKSVETEEDVAKVRLYLSVHLALVISREQKLELSKSSKNRVRHSLKGLSSEDKTVWRKNVLVGGVTEYRVFCEKSGIKPTENEYFCKVLGELITLNPYKVGGSLGLKKPEKQAILSMLKKTKEHGVGEGEKGKVEKKV